MTLALDAPWGAGKSYFLKQLVSNAKRERKWQVVYYDAFRHDHNDEAFLPLIGAIVADLGLGEGQSTSNAKVIGRKIMGAATRIGIRLATGGLLASAEWNGALEDEIEREAGALAGAVASQIESYQKKQRDIDAFIEAINEFVETKKETEPDYRLLVIVDELDRCRPEFAVQTLERTKHLFEGANCSFLFGVNHAELSEVIKGHYGEGFSGSKYLQRFFDVRVPLSSKVAETARYYRSIATLSNDQNGVALYALRTLERGCLKFSPSMRDIERLIQGVRQINNNVLTGEAEFGLVALLSWARICTPDDYPALCASPTDLATWYRLFDIEEFDSDVSRSQYALKTLLQVVLGEVDLRSTSHKKELVRASFHFARGSVNPRSAPHIIELYANLAEGGFPN